MKTYQEYLSATVVGNLKDACSCLTNQAGDAPMNARELSYCESDGFTATDLEKRATYRDEPLQVSKADLSADGSEAIIPKSAVTIGGTPLSSDIKLRVFDNQWYVVN